MVQALEAMKPTLERHLEADVQKMEEITILEILLPSKYGGKQKSVYLVKNPKSALKATFFYFTFCCCLYHRIEG
jgi:hypothetical protein